jgi:hypothetical protein
VTKEPEQVLEQNGVSTTGDIKETSVKMTVKQYHSNGCR